MAKKKLFIVKFKYENDDVDVVILKAFAGHLSASQYVEADVRRFNKDFNSENGTWEDPWHYTYCVNKGSQSSSMRFQEYEIEEVEVEEEVTLPKLPAIERENLSLKNENVELHEKLANAEKSIAEAKSWLTMWDGGWNYDKKHILNNVHAAKSILERCSESTVIKVTTMLS